MTPAERRQLVEMPLPSTRYYPRKSWAGAYIRESVPTEGRRVMLVTLEDEEILKSIGGFSRADMNMMHIERIWTDDDTQIAENTEGEVAA